MNVMPAWRGRVEAFALEPTTSHLLCGVYEDRTVGVFGGGQAVWETIMQAACREFLEKSGHKLLQPQPVPVPVLEYVWTFGNAIYKGSRTSFVWGWLASGKRAPVIIPPGLNDIRLVPLEVAIRVQKYRLDDQQDTKVVMHAAARLRALIWLAGRVADIKAAVAVD